MTRADLTTCGRNILPEPNRSPTTFMPSISGPSITCSGRSAFFFSSRRRHTRSVSAFLLNRSSDLLVRFPPTATKEIQYLNAKGALTYTDIAGDPVLYGNLPPREISMKDVFRSGDSSKKFKIAEGQWYRYAPSYVSPAYHLLEGF